MNYNRRSTRPDSLFYREQRKLRRSRAQQALRPAALITFAILATAVLYWVFRKP